MSGLLGWLAPTLAFAHPGDHTHMTFAEGVRHLLSEPDHQLMLAAIAAVAAFGGWSMLRARRPG